MGERDHRIDFPCGASYRRVDGESWEQEIGRNGRIKLLVLDTQSQPGRCEKPVTPPKHDDGSFAGCLFLCPTKKYRRQQRTMRDDGADPFAFRMTVTCSGVLAPDDTPSIGGAT